MKPTCLLSSFAVLLAIPVFAQNQQQGGGQQRPAAPAPLIVPEMALTPAQTAHILKELEKAESQIGQGRGGVFSTALSKFRSAMSGDTEALGLYLDCVKLQNFERKDLKQADFVDWREKNEARLKEGDFPRGLALQLEYLVLTLQAQDIDDPEKMGPIVTALQGYIGKIIGEVQASMKHTASGAVEVKDVATKGNAGGQRRGGGAGVAGMGGSALVGVLRQSVKGCEFSRAYLLEDYLTRKEWEYSPLNIEGLFSSVIFPYYKTEKPEELGTQWDARINAELALRKAILSETEYNIYAQQEHPRLQWQKQRDLLATNVNAINALAEMLKIIQANPNHPEAKEWLATFKIIMTRLTPGAGEPVEKPIGSQ